jgi:hypothetical protein
VASGWIIVVSAHQYPRGTNRGDCTKRTGKVALDLYTTEILIFNSLTPFAVIIPLIACLTYQTNGIRIGLADMVADKKLLKRLYATSVKR